MHDPIPTREPQSVTAGDTWQWRKRVQDHPPDDGWELVYYLEGPSNPEFAGAAEANGLEWLVTVPPATTEAVLPAAYQLHGFVQKVVNQVVTERHRIYRGGLEVVQDPANITAPRRSHVEETYNLIVARIEGRLPADREQFAIDGTQITRIAIAELTRLRGIYAELLRQELAPDRSPIRSVIARDVV